MKANRIVRIFGSTDCEDCKKVVSLHKNMGWDYEYVDAIADETQDLCDLHNVDKLPHVQYFSENGNVVRNVIGIDDFVELMKEMDKKIEDYLKLDEIK